jgi:two-component system, NtrC family, nitrogen regulation response regulator NtrX
MARILIIDDEENIRKTLKDILEDEAHQVLLAEEGESGLALFREEKPDVVLLDIKMPGKEGLEILEIMKKSGVDSEIIMISGHATIEAAVKAIKMGAYHFIQKPLSLIEIKQSVRHAAMAKRQRDEIDALKSDTDERFRLIGDGHRMVKIREQIQKVAPTQGRVLITGESGTGKELVAYAIHRGSQRCTAPFVKMNCAAIPQNLIESELFGHEKGAFTGAVALKQGKFELAHGGTLLLDEIGDMDLDTQAKVLRVLQEGEFERVGGVKTLKVDVRIITATHRDLEKRIAEGRFREDLYYRLNVVPIHMPALSERQEDIPLLAEHFLGRYRLENGMKARRFEKGALAFLGGLRYQGNIRELKNVVERAAILCEQEEIPEAFLKGLLSQKEEQGGGLFMLPRPLGQAKEELERAYVKAQLELSGWNIQKTADILGIARTNLHRKMKQLGIEH